MVSDQAAPHTDNPTKAVGVLSPLQPSWGNLGPLQVLNVKISIFSTFNKFLAIMRSSGPVVRPLAARALPDRGV